MTRDKVVTFHHVNPNDTNKWQILWTDFSLVESKRINEQQRNETKEKKKLLH